MATTVGYTLENQAYKALPHLLQRDFNLRVQRRLKRGYLKDNQGQELEVNLIGQARKEDRTVIPLGESKSQLSKQKVDVFIRKRLRRDEARAFYQEVLAINPSNTYLCQRQFAKVATDASKGVMK